MISYCRGSDDSGRVKKIDSDRISKTSQGNFKAILSLLADSNQPFDEFLNNSPLSAQYTSWNIQNQLIEIIAAKISLENISLVNDSVCWGISFDETPDRSKKEQISLVIRYVSKESLIQEIFVGFFDAFSFEGVERLDAKTLSKLIFDILTKRGLDMSKLVTVCTDGASLMSGKDGGCIKIMKETYPHLLYSICFSHSLNLCIDNAFISPNIIDVFSVIYKLVSFFQFPKRNSVLVRVQELHKLKPMKLIDPSPTRQIQRLEAIHRVKLLYKVCFILIE